MAQIPQGPNDLDCPFHRKAMKRVCHKCPLWRQIRGRDPNTGQEIDEWNCSLAWAPTLLIEIAKQSRSGAAATESFRNEMLTLNLVHLNEAAKTKETAYDHHPLLEQKNNALAIR